MTITRIPCPLPSCTIERGSGALFGNTAALGGQPHMGLDLVAPLGTPIHSPLNGVVTNVTNSIDGGLGLWIAHDDRLTTLYAHMSRVIVQKGDTLQAGRIIGYSGATGHVTGPHLHFGVLVDGQFVDPAPYLGLSTSTKPRVVPRNADGSCPAGYIPGAQTHAFECVLVDALSDVPVVGGALGFANDPVGGILGTLPRLLEPALSLAVVASSAMLVWSGLNRLLGR